VLLNKAQFETFKVGDKFYVLLCVCKLLLDRPFYWWSDSLINKSFAEALRSDILGDLGGHGCISHEQYIFVVWRTGDA
jgi:hypothetical protein